MSFGPQAEKSEFIEKSLKQSTETAVNLYMEIMTLTNFSRHISILTRISIEMVQKYGHHYPIISLHILGKIQQNH